MKNIFLLITLIFISLNAETSIYEKDVEKNANDTNSIPKFEKIFINHLAYNSYQQSIEKLYESNYKEAYTLAMKAKLINNNKGEYHNVIALPYMPIYTRESAYSPKDIRYKIVKYKNYELDKLITKIKLLSPPIASIVIKRTSTYVDIIVCNYGDLPLDGFELLLNNKSVIKYNKILPSEEKVYRYEEAPQLYELSFKEEYGFVPNSMILNEGY